jgi:hypothetical protein
MLYPTELRVPAGKVLQAAHCRKNRLRAIYTGIPHNSQHACRNNKITANFNVLHGKPHLTSQRAPFAARDSLSHGGGFGALQGVEESH